MTQQNTTWINDSYSWEDTEGEWHKLLPLSLPLRSKMLKLLTEIYSYLESLGVSEREQTIGELYSSDNRFRYLCHSVLELVGIDFERISLNFLFALIFPSDNKPHGILVSMNFTEKELEASIDVTLLKQLKTSETSETSLLANQLNEIATMMDGNIPKAMEMAEKLSAIELQQMVELWKAKNEVEELNHSLMNQQLMDSKSKVWKYVQRGLI